MDFFVLGLSTGFGVEESDEVGGDFVLGDLL